MSTLAAVRLWGTRIGAVSMPDDGPQATFQYDRDFLNSGIEVSPLVMPLRSEPYTFATLNSESFHGLPGLLADCLPDRYGHALIDAWLAGQGRTPESFDAVERLCYIGRRGMGALEFAPSQGPTPSRTHNLQVAELVELASEVLTQAGAHRLARTGPSAAGDARHPERRRIRRGCACQGGHRLESRDRCRALRSDRRSRVRASSTGC